MCNMVKLREHSHDMDVLEECALIVFKLILKSKHFLASMNLPPNSENTFLLKCFS
jgi:hypothetical protein